MCLAHVGDDAKIWQHNLHQSLDFARMVRTHLHNGEIMLLRELQQSLRHTNMVVEVTLRIEHIVFLLQHGGNEFLRGRLAIRTRNANDGSAQVDTMIFRQLL